MALLDWIAVALLVVSMLLGLVRGLVFEVILLAGWVVAFLCAQWLADDVGRWLPFGEPAATWRYAAGFVLVFVAVGVLVGVFVATLVLVAVGELVGVFGTELVLVAVGVLVGVFVATLVLVAVGVLVGVFGTTLVFVAVAVFE